MESNKFNMSASEDQKQANKRKAEKRSERIKEKKLGGGGFRPMTMKLGEALT